MRFSLYAPLLGLSAMAALAQYSPRGLYNTNQEVTKNWSRGSLPVAEEPQFAPRLTCELCTAAVPAGEKQGGTNRGAIERAIRALGSRIFPGQRLAAGHGSRLRMDRQPGFRILNRR